MSWTCHARPAALGGKQCGHLNEGEPVFARVGMGNNFEYCKGCGCSRAASEDRLRRTQNKAPIGLDVL